MKRLVTVFLIAMFLVSSGYADYGLKLWRFAVVDNDTGDMITDANFTITVYDNDGVSAGTIYSDEYATAKTNPIVYANDSAAAGGDLQFYCAYSSIDITISSAVYAGTIKRSGLTITDHRIVFPLTELTGNVSAGTISATGNVTFGINGTGVDVTFYGDTTGDYGLWDYSADEFYLEDTDLRINEGGQIEFSYTDDAVDWTIKMDAAETLKFIPTETTDDQAIYIGADTTGADLKLFGATTAEYLLWDASGDDLIGNYDSTLFTQTGAAANQFKVDATGTVAGYAIVFETTDGGVQINADGASNGDINIDAADDMTLTAAGDLTFTVTGTPSFSKTVVFTGGQTRKVKFLPSEVTLDGTAPPTLIEFGTDGQTQIGALSFDADGGSTGDDIAFISWAVPDGYVTDSARLNVAYTFDTAEDAADESQFDFAVNAAAAGEALDAAGTALADQATVIADASTGAGKLYITQYNIEVEEIAVDDLVTIKIAIDESASAMSASGTLDVLYLEIEYESTE